MTFRERLHLCRERWLSILVLMLIGVLAAVGFVLSSTPQYAAKVTLFVSAGTSTDPSAALDRNSLSVQRMPTYVELITSQKIANEVVETLGLDMTGSELSGRITADNAPGTVLLTATVTDPDPELAAEIANELADRFVANVEAIEFPSGTRLVAVVTANVFEKAVPPVLPESLDPTLVVAIGALLGLLAGIALAILRHVVAPTISDARQLADVARAPVLGVVARRRGAGNRPLVVCDDARSPRAEEYRRLRANLQAVLGGEAHRIVMFVSPAPQDGTTSVLCNVACAMAESGQRVLVVEADYSHPRAADLLGVGRTAGLVSVLAPGGARIEDVVQHSEAGVDVVSSGPIPENPGRLLTSPQMRRFLAEVRPRYDVVLVDVAPVLRAADATVLAPLADAIVLVVRKGAPVGRVESAREALEVVSARLVGTVLSGARGGMVMVRGDERLAAAVPERAAALPAPTQSPAVPTAVAVQPTLTPWPRNPVEGNGERAAQEQPNP